MTNKIELDAECVADLVAGGARWSSRREEVRAALTEHGVEENPLGLPWEYLHAHGACVVRCSRGTEIHVSGDPSAAKLIANAPKVVDFVLGILENLSNLNDGALFIKEEQVRQLLIDSGRVKADNE